MDILSQYVYPGDGVVGQVMEREAVLILTQHGQVKVLNEVGATIWSLIDGSCTVGQIAASIAASYDVTLAEAEQDISDFLKLLKAKDIIRLG